MIRTAEVIAQQKKKLPDIYGYVGFVCRQDYPVTANEPFIHIYWVKEYSDGGKMDWAMAKESIQKLEEFLLTGEQ